MVIVVIGEAQRRAKLQTRVGGDNQTCFDAVDSQTINSC